MNTPEIAKCPNPECSKDVPAPLEHAEYQAVVTGRTLFRIECKGCGYCGPDSENEFGAIHLHNAICRQPTPEAADAYGVFLDGAVVNNSVFDTEREAIRERDQLLQERDGFIVKALFAHPPKPEPTEAPPAVSAEWMAEAVKQEPIGVLCDKGHVRSFEAWNPKPGTYDRLIETGWNVIPLFAAAPKGDK